MSTTPKLPVPTPVLPDSPREPKTSTVVYLPDEMMRRLGKYMYERFPGKNHIRNRVILGAIEAMLKTEGY